MFGKIKEAKKLISLKEKIIMKAIYYKSNKKRPYLTTEVGTKRKKRYLFFVLYENHTQKESEYSFDIKKNSTSLTFIAKAEEKEYKNNVENYNKYNSYFFVSISDEYKINEFVELEID